MDKKMLNIALPKGRLGERVCSLLAETPFGCAGADENSRKLIFEDPENGIRCFWVKPSDAAIYVERGAADLGVCGSDILTEQQPDVYELLDLKIGACRMAAAALKDFRDRRDRALRVATKFVKTATDFYRGKGRQTDIIKLNGSIELAPVLGLSDVIVDIVETGTTLRENGLVIIEEIAKISARLICNKASAKFDTRRINELTAALGAVTENIR